MGCTSSSKKKHLKEEGKVEVPEISAGSSDNMSSQNLMAPQFPALSSQQRLSSGSGASGRNKVALKPGHSLMDWIRLGRSGKDLTGVGGPKPYVTKEELEKHNTEKDAWLLLRGKVYNITPYLEFHPGGVDELMRGAGKDATQLFDEIHKWVNAESMLEKCFIGKLQEDIPTSKKESLKRRNLKTNGPMAPPSLLPPAPQGPQPPRFDWFQSNKLVTVVVYTKWEGMREELVMIDRPQGKQLLITMYIQDFVFQIHIDLEHDITVDYEVKVSGDKGKVNFVFNKSEENVQWSSLGKHLDKHNTYIKYCSFNHAYRECTLERVTSVSRDCNLYAISLPPGTRMCVPMGYHVHIRHRIEGVEVVRSYTVVLPSLLGDGGDMLVREGKVVYLMIKIYPDGALTPWIGSLKPGDKIEMSSFDGNFVLSRARESTHLVLFAAGTGFTPMVRLISDSCGEDTQSNRTVKLMFFNKTEADILWRDQLSALAEASDRFSITNVLSEADDNWSGPRGRVSKEMMKGFIPESQENRLLICACGPTAFTGAVMRYAEELGYSKDCLHAFLG